MTRFSLRNIQLGSLIGHTFFLTALVLCAAWLATATSFHLSGATLWAAWLALGATSVLSAIYRFRKRRLGWLIFVMGALVSTIWYQTILPSDQKHWAFDVENGVKASIQGDVVSLSDVRNFDWQDAQTAQSNWENHTYDLSTLASVDMLTSVWNNPDIAHLLVSFGFENGDQVVFSIETRKESHESFSALGGFFRQYELVLIAATEEDIIKLRTNHRKEDVRLYPVALSPKQRRDLFLSYVDLAQSLEDSPTFYNTLTANCTTTAYELAQVVKPDMTLNWRILLSGHLPGFVDDLGGFAVDMPIHERVEKAAITQKAQDYAGSNFSRGIRQ